MEEKEENVRRALETAKFTLKCAAQNLAEGSEYDYWFGVYTDTAAEVRALQVKLLQFEVSRHIRGAS